MLTNDELWEKVAINEPITIDQIEFLEDCLGIKLLAGQKEMLRRMLSNKTYIHPWHSYERPNIRMINVIRKCYSLMNDDLSDLKGEVNVVSYRKRTTGSII